MILNLALPPQAELKTLQETASPSFSFANDLIKHNLVSGIVQFQRISIPTPKKVLEILRGGGFQSQNV